MPAYGPQIIPNVPEVPAPILGKADMSVPRLMAEQGAAGLAAFTNLAAQAARAQTEREQLAQHGALQMQGFQVQRENNALDYKLGQQQIAAAANLERLRHSLDAKDAAEEAADALGFMEGQNANPFKTGTQENYDFQMELLRKYPLALKNEKLLEKWMAKSADHDRTAQISGVASQMKNPRIQYKFGPNGVETIVEDNPSQDEWRVEGREIQRQRTDDQAAAAKAAQEGLQESRADRQQRQQETDYQKERDRRRDIEAELIRVQQEAEKLNEEAAKQKAYNEGLGAKRGWTGFDKSKEKVPFTQSKRLEILNNRAIALQKELDARPITGSKGVYGGATTRGVTLQSPDGTKRVVAADDPMIPIYKQNGAVEVAQ